MCSAQERPRHISRERLTKLLPEAYEKYDQLICAMDHMVEYRKETISQLRSIADQLNERRRDVNIAKFVGGAVGAAGAAATVTGIVLSPFTLGGSLLFMIPGVVAFGSGTTTAVGADLAGSILNKMDLEKAQRAVDSDRKQCQWVLKLWKEFESYSKKIIDIISLVDPSEGTDITSMKTWIKTIFRRWKEVTSSALVGAALKKVTSYMSSTGKGNKLFSLLESEKGKMLLSWFQKAVEGIGSYVPAPILGLTGTLFVKGCAIAGASILVAGIRIFDLAMAIISLIDLRRGSVSTVACDLRHTAQELNTELDEWKSVFGELASK